MFLIVQVVKERIQQSTLENQQQVTSFIFTDTEVFLTLSSKLMNNGAVYIALFRVIEFVNIHLFHDDSNLVSMKSTPSPYTSYRKRALKFVMQRYKAP